MNYKLKLSALAIGLMFIQNPVISSNAETAEKNGETVYKSPKSLKDLARDSLFESVKEGTVKLPDDPNTLRHLAGILGSIDMEDPEYSQLLPYAECVVFQNDLVRVDQKSLNPLSPEKLLQLNLTSMDDFDMKHIDRFTNLRIFDLCGWIVQNPQSLKNLQALRCLSLNCFLDGVDSMEPFSLPLLHSLDLNAASIGIASKIKNISQIQRLSLDANYKSYSEKSLKVILPALNNLRSFAFFGYYTRGAPLLAHLNHEKITELDFTCKWYDYVKPTALIAFLKELGSQDFALSVSTSHPDLLAVLPKIRRLHSLSLTGSYEELSKLPSLPMLQQLSISTCSMTPVQEIPTIDLSRFVKGCGKLESLRVNGNVHAEDLGFTKSNITGFNSLLALKNLKKLKIHYFSRSNLKELHEFIKKIPEDVEYEILPEGL